MTPRDPIEELIEHIDRWHAPNADHTTGWLFKLGEEVGELMGAYVKEKPSEDEAGEAADVLICLLLFCRSRGIDLIPEALKKMDVNEARSATGKVNRFGVFVKAADLPPIPKDECPKCRKPLVEHRIARTLEGNLKVACPLDCGCDYRAQVVCVAHLASRAFTPLITSHQTPEHTCWFSQNPGGERWREGVKDCPACTPVTP